MPTRAHPNPHKDNGVDAIEALTTRASPAALAAPAPDAAALDRMLHAAVRAPDHGRLRPWHFIIVDGDARTALGELLAAALRTRDPGAAEAVVAKERAKPMRAPLLVVVAAKLHEHRGVPAIEQVIAAGAAAQNILVAAHAQGFGGFWRTGPAAYDENVKRGLGLRPADAIIAFLYLGTPSAAAPPVGSADVAAHVTHWTGPVHDAGVSA